ncbi:acyl-CoA dehydrogenase [Belliella kenyensis]|uniref:Acyl-CoA dehydrogenase n=1 Tax=Belliella kenyensis TaxID=1472724 RepID=A0ABV8EL30_9BACT|nr:acyl-CoA dehydrogenase [Belliella kenyensis]MCH7400475.1 acyl-CoA dehydrogenase family protein [Belliella kenyensis]MDN3604509.1 acyl-CoA dehydrogenase [Belliella kenyensis]
MIQSELTTQNPKIYIFLPLYYTLWADSVLTPLEIEEMKSLISRQKWINPLEKNMLIEHLNPALPPKPKLLKSWKKEIKNLDISADSGLTSIGLKLVEKYDRDAKFSESEIEDFHRTELALGLLGKEAGYAFRTGHETITAKHKANSTFDITEMISLLDGDQQKVIQKVKKIISDPSFAYREYESLSDQREQVLTWCKVLSEHGLGAWAFPKFAGGKDDMKGYFTIMETLSYHDLSLVIKFGVQFGLWGMSVFFLGTDKHHKKYLKDIGSLDLPGCFAMTETGHGSNVRGLETTATYDHNSSTFTIHTPNPEARKEYIGNAAVHGQMATVFAKLIIDGEDFGVNAFIVPLRDQEGNLVKGVQIEDCGRKMGLNGVDNGVIYFDNVVIPKEQMLDRFSSVNDEGEFESEISSDNRRFFTMLGTLVGGRIGIPRSALSAAKTGLTIAIRHGEKRKQFGPEGGAEVPILNYRMHQRRLMPPLAASYALHFGLRYLTKRFLERTEEEAQEIEALAAGMKAYTTWFTTATLQECREACGGKGYLSENRIDALKNDTDVYTTFEGDNVVLMQLVAKNRLTEFRQEFGDMNMFTIFNYVVNQAKTSIAEKNPLIIRSTEQAHLLDMDFHLSAFKYRERAILASAAQRIKRHIDEGMDSFDAFNVVQHHLLNVGQAYIERIILEEFQKEIIVTSNYGVKTALTQLCQLFALHTIEKNRGWYLEQGYMEGVKTKAIRKEVNQLCWEIRKNALALTAAFDIPESCIAAPIAKI